MTTFFSAWRWGTWARWLLLVLLLGAGAAGTQAQPDQLPLDTLQARLARPGLADSLRVEYLKLVGARLITTDMAAARRYTEQSRALAQRIGHHSGEILALNNLAAMSYYVADYPAAQRTFETLLRVSQRAAMPEQVANAWLGLGNVAQSLGNFPRALRHFEQARQVYATMTPPSPNGQVMVLHNSANAYDRLHQPARAARARRQALALVKVHETNANLHVSVLVGLARNQATAGQPDSALATLARGLAIARLMHDLAGEASVLTETADLELTLARPERAHASATRGVALARQVGDAVLQENALSILATAMRRLRQLDAYDTLRTFLALHDTILTQDRADAIIEAQTRFDLAGQQARIRALEQQRRIAGLEARERSLQTRWLLGWLAALAVLGAGGLTWLYRRRQARHDMALRTRLAADLHDEVGTLLSQISLQSALLEEGLYPAAEQGAQLAEVAAASRSAVRQLNDVVWTVDAHNDHLTNLLDRMRDYAFDVLQPAGVEVRFAPDPAIAADRLPVVLRRNLYLIFVGSSRVDLQACKLEYSIVSPK